MNFAPTFADFINSMGGRTDMTQAQWDALSPADRMQMGGGTFQIRPDDPRYNDYKPLVGGEAGRNLYISNSSANDVRGGLAGSEYKGPGFFAHSEDAESPQQQENKPDYMPFLLPLAFMAAPYALSAMGFEGAGYAAGEGPLSGLLGGSSGGVGNPFGPGAFDSDGFSAALSGSEGGGAGGLGPGAFDSDGFSSALSGSGNYAPVTEASTGASGAPVTDLSVNAAGGTGGLLNSIGGVSGLLRAAGLGMSAYGLLNGNHNNSNGNSSNNNGSSGGDKGGGGQALNVSRGPYTPNPITQQQLQNFRYAQPRGR